jgi:putative ABC transport system permease protein
MLGKGDGFDEIQVAAKPGVSPQELKTQLASTLGPTVDVRTGQEQADKESKDIRDNLGFLKTFLLAFAFIALFVGAFLIFNTFSITVAQRMRASSASCWASEPPRSCARCSRPSAPTCRARASSSRPAR